ncbi:glycine betaine/proline transport system ATP-binding protein [Methylopila capsulata]|uniref:Choline ABC transporter ATP-binding protein n=1 Tax=Methylopila capsulata TaxID=61654 RepID=A0A9W6IVH1_9HYPH|nr:choline ABC transporter ATP-binding protein [Methylopila capsulata]MBM7853512.1 glycine betaine/proline transport system ATP-binding protein [Methylopila capsulata]GLK57273.1 choline ABC transporter ATP-binding protein [Methylopila capsulata]
MTVIAEPGVAAAVPASKPSRADNAVELRDLAIIFGRTKEALALADQGANRDEIRDRTGAILGAYKVDLDIRNGEICVLMGLSGSGKSTVLRAVNGLNTTARGEVMVCHEGALVDVATCGAKTLRDIRLKTVSMVFQQFGLLPWRSVRDNVGFGLEIRGMGAAERRAIVDEKLEMVGLSNWADKQVQELSGGMQQRVGLARAFATDADILLMDEPFSALDPLIRDKLQDDLLALQEKLHKTIIFVSHDLSEALKIGNRIAIMEGGRVVQFGAPADIMLRPADAYVAEFVKRMNPLDVLCADAVMTPTAKLSREAGAVMMDGDGGAVALTLCSEGKPLTLMINGQVRTIGAVDVSGAVTRKGDVVVAPAELPLKTAIDVRRQSNYPIALVDQLGRLAGLCDHEDIYRGLLR